MHSDWAVVNRNRCVMADWGHLERRYIYVNPDPDWMAVPAPARALAALLTVHFNAEGAIPMRVGEGPSDAIARVVQAHGPDELAWCRSATDVLLADTHLVVDGPTDAFKAGRVRSRNYRIAQGITETAGERSARLARDAERKAKERAAKRVRV